MFLSIRHLQLWTGANQRGSKQRRALPDHHTKALHQGRFITCATPRSIPPLHLSDLPRPQVNVDFPFRGIEGLHDVTLLVRVRNAKCVANLVHEDHEEAERARCEVGRPCFGAVHVKIPSDRGSGEGEISVREDTWVVQEKEPCGKNDEAKRKKEMYARACLVNTQQH